MHTLNCRQNFMQVPRRPVATGSKPVPTPTPVTGRAWRLQQSKRPHPFSGQLLSGGTLRQIDSVQNLWNGHVDSRGHSRIAYELIDGNKRSVAPARKNALEPKRMGQTPRMRFDLSDLVNESPVMVEINPALKRSRISHAALAAWVFFFGSSPQWGYAVLGQFIWSPENDTCHSTAGRRPWFFLRSRSRSGVCRFAFDHP